MTKTVARSSQLKVTVTVIVAATYTTAYKAATALVSYAPPSGATNWGWPARAGYHRLLLPPPPLIKSPDVSPVKV